MTWGLPDTKFVTKLKGRTPHDRLAASFAGVKMASNASSLTLKKQRNLVRYLAVDRVAVGLKSLEFALHDGKKALFVFQFHLLAYLAAPQLQESVPNLVLNLETGVLQVLESRAQSCSG